MRNYTLAEAPYVFGTVLLIAWPYNARILLAVLLGSFSFVIGHTIGLLSPSAPGVTSWCVSEDFLQELCNSMCRYASVARRVLHAVEVDRVQNGSKRLMSGGVTLCRFCVSNGAYVFARHECCMSRHTACCCCRLSPLSIQQIA
jgi:hypothetical protein